VSSLPVVVSAGALVRANLLLEEKAVFGGPSTTSSAITVSQLYHSSAQCRGYLPPLLETLVLVCIKLGLWPVLKLPMGEASPLLLGLVTRDFASLVVLSF
jgi:hypothetical protein